MRHSFTLFKHFGLPIISATAQTDRQRRRYIRPCPPWYSPTLSARAGHDSLGGHCHSSHIARKTGKNHCGLPFTFPPTDGANLTACFDGGLPVLMAVDLNSKQMDWNSRLSTRRGKLLPDYADKNSCLIFGPDTQPPSHTTPPVLLMSWTS